MKCRIVLKVYYSKIDKKTGLIVRRDCFWISSLSADYVDNFCEWFSRHLIKLKTEFENFSKSQSGLVFDGLEFALFKLSFKYGS